MKKLSKFAIFSLLFALCCVFVFFETNYIQTNAMELNAIYTLDNEETAEAIEIKFINETDVEITKLNKITEEKTVKTTTYEIKTDENEVEYIVLIGDPTDETTNINIVLNEETKTIEQYLPPLIEEEHVNGFQKIKDKIEAWITAFLVAILGNATLFGIVRLFLNKTIKGTNKVIEKLAEKNVLNEKQVEYMKEKVEVWEEKCNNLVETNKKLIEAINNKMVVDDEKVKKINDMLDKLLPADSKTGADLIENKE